MTFITRHGRYSKRGMTEVEERRVFCEAYLTYAGESELYGEPVIWSDWERNNIWEPLFGTGSVIGNGKFKRKYRRALIGVHRSYGKSQLAAEIILTEATLNEHHNAMYGIVADGLGNTQNIKNYIKAMISNSPDLAAEWRPYKNEIVNTRTNQRILVFPYKEGAMQSKHFDVLVCDEVHMFRDDSVWKGAISSQSKIFNSITIGITTAGKSRDGFLFKLYRELKHADDAYVCWLGIDDDDNPMDRSCWRKITIAGRITLDEMEAQLTGLGAKAFERYVLNRTPMDESEEPFMRREDVEACSTLDFKLDRDSWFCVAIDGAVRGDTLAVVAAQRVDERNWAFEEWCWDTTGPMEVYDLMDVADVLQMLAQSSGCPMMVCDPARMQFLVNWLDRERGMGVTDFPQKPSMMCPASELLARCVSTHTAGLQGTPVLAQHCINAVSAESKAYGRRLSSERGRHGKGSKRIDAAVAAAMAMYAYDNNESDAPSIWEIDL